jgi:putative DNA methylase
MMSETVKVPKKLIEVALPLNAINEEAARRKRKAPAGYPTTLHKWWAQRPVAAVRAVIFGQLVNDPSWKWEIHHPGEVPPSNLKASWAASRKRLFSTLTDLLKWENTTNEEVFAKALAEIRSSWLETCELNRAHPQAAKLFDPERIPTLYDPFAGAATIPMEGQRIGLSVLASDLNPVAVLINKAMIEIPAIFSGRSPVGPFQIDQRNEKLALPRNWLGTKGLADDVRRYGAWMREEAHKRIGYLYPQIEMTKEMAHGRPDLKSLIGKKLKAVAWLWARTVKSPSPAFRDVDVPLVSTFVLSSKGDKQAYIQPIIEGKDYRFIVKVGRPAAQLANGTKAPGRGANFRCLVSDAPIGGAYIKAEGQAGRIGSKLMAIVAEVEGQRGRIYLSPTNEMESIAREADPGWRPTGEVPARLTGGTCVPYGLKEWGDLFTPRQLAALTTFSDLVSEAREKISRDALLAGMSDDPRGLSTEGCGATAYAEAISVYLAFAVDRLADYGSTIATWRTKDSAMRSSLASQSIPMTWDYAEGSPFATSSSGFSESVNVIATAIELLPDKAAGRAFQCAAQNQLHASGCIISTDPPYYNNIAYADLSDFFYVWLRRSLKSVFPTILSTMAAPKSEELVATPYRHGGEENAEKFFLDGMTQAMRMLAHQMHPGAPLTIYYAFKQSETTTETGTSSTGWETFLEAVNRAGLSLTGTWPMRTEGDNRQIGIGANALASSIVLTCRPRPSDAPTVSRRAFLRELYQALPEALDEMTRISGDELSPVAPVDLSQAMIGPGMAVFSKYAAVLEADGTPMSVKTALRLINRFFAEDDFDSDTQFCLHWFEQNGWKDGIFGTADTLARAKGTSVEGVKQSGTLYATGGVVRLLKWGEYPIVWDHPTNDRRLSVWELLHQLIRVFKSKGESGAGAVLAGTQDKAESARQLAYRLYTLCERAGWAEDARAYNELITSWSAIEAAAAKVPSPKQAELFDV